MGIIFIIFNCESSFYWVIEVNNFYLLLNIKSIKTNWSLLKINKNKLKKILGKHYICRKKRYVFCCFFVIGIKNIIYVKKDNVFLFFSYGTKKIWDLVDELINYIYWLFWKFILNYWIKTFVTEECTVSFKVKEEMKNWFVWKRKMFLCWLPTKRTKQSVFECSFKSDLLPNTESFSVPSSSFHYEHIPPPPRRRRFKKMDVFQPPAVIRRLLRQAGITRSASSSSAAATVFFFIHPNLLSSTWRRWPRRRRGAAGHRRARRPLDLPPHLSAEPCQLPEPRQGSPPDVRRRRHRRRLSRTRARSFQRGSRPPHCLRGHGKRSPPRRRP